MRAKKARAIRRTFHVKHVRHAPKCAGHGTQMPHHTANRLAALQMVGGTGTVLQCPDCWAAVMRERARHGWEVQAWPS